MSGLFNQASLVLVPSGYKAGKVYSQVPTSGDGDLTFTRASSATRVNAEGLIETASIIGSELVTNGDFSGGSANWVNYISGSSTIVFTDVATLNIDASNSNVGIYQEDVFTSGKQYKIVLKMKASSSFDAEILETQGASVISAIGSVSLTTSYQNFTFYFTATGSNDIFIHRLFSAPSANQSITIENVSVKEYTTSNVPRLDYSQGSCPALLLEPQRTNLALYSEEFDNASWLKVRTTITQNNIIAPNGTMTADKMTADIDTLTYGIDVTTLTGTGTFTASIFAKKGSVDWLYIRQGNSGGGTTIARAWFDLNNGVVGGATPPPISYKIEDYGNGWYRCSMTFQVLAGGIPRPQFYLSTGDGINLFTSDGTENLFIWGAQLEEGAYATSYIPTTNATVTRLADTFTRNNIYTNGLITSSGGTWVVELKNNVEYLRDANNGVFLGDSTFINSGNQFAIRNFSAIGSTVLSLVKYIGGTSTNIYPILHENVKLAIKWNGTTADVFANGVKEVSATAFTTTNMENLIGSGASVPYFIQSMQLYPTPLEDVDCEVLTGEIYTSYSEMATALGYTII